MTSLNEKTAARCIEELYLDQINVLTFTVKDLCGGKKNLIPAITNAYNCNTKLLKTKDYNFFKSRDFKS